MTVEIFYPGTYELVNIVINDDKFRAVLDDIQVCDSEDYHTKYSIEYKGNTMGSMYSFVHLNKPFVMLSKITGNKYLGKSFSDAIQLWYDEEFTKKLK